MRRTQIFLYSLLTLCVSCFIANAQDYAGPIARELSTEVCVVGGGSAGIAASVAAGREGANVILVEKLNVLGGTSTAGMVSSWEGGPGCEISTELYRRMKDANGAGVAKETPSEGLNIPHGFRIVSDEPYEISLVRAKPPAGGYRSVPFLPEAFDRAANDMILEMKNVQILFESEFFQAERGEKRVESILVRNVKDGSVVRIRAKVFIDATGSVVLCRNLGCEILVGEESPDVFGEPDAPQEPKPRLNAMTRCYRIEPRENPRTEIIAPEDVVPFPRCAWVTGWKDGPRFVNMLGMMPGEALLSLGYDECMARSEKIVRNHWAFLQTFPDFRNYELVEIAPMMGIREDYRVKTKYVLRSQDIFGGWDAQTHPDRIAVADHPADIHGAGGGLRQVKTAYGVPYRCLIPDVPYENLLVACRGAGFSKIAASSCRLQRTMMQLGHAAGVAAAWAARAGCSVEEIDVPKLVEKLDAHKRYAWQTNFKTLE